MSGPPAVLWVLLGALLAPGAAAGFQISSPIHNDCHERFTVEALARARRTPGLPAEPTDKSRVLSESVQFEAGRYGRDLLMVSLMLGVRYNDIHDKSTLDLGGIVPVHNVPQRQREHCLRSGHHDGEQGRRAALADCTTFIRDLVQRATAGRDDLDPWETEEVDVYLLYRGAATVRVSRLYFNLGRALHVVQDSFSHTVRSADGRRIVDVCNWIDDLDGTLDAGRDGCPHLTLLDNCACTSPAFDRLLRRTVDASVDLLDAVLAAGDASDRAQRLRAFLARWMRYEPGCGPENGYCGDALLAEVAAGEVACPGVGGCRTTGGGRAWPALLVVAALVVLAVARRRRLLVLLLVPALLLPAGVAGAGEAGTDRCAKPAAEPGLYVTLRNGISSDRPALSFEGGALYRGRRWGAGLYADYNPFLSFERGIEATSGAFNIAASGTLHFQLTRRLSMRFELRAGLSVLLFRTPGYDVGSLGLFLGLRALGLDYRLWRRLYLHVDPVDVGMPVFKVDKLPFYYKQWRVAGGLGWRFL